MKLLVAPFSPCTGNKAALGAFYLQPLPDCSLLREGWPFFVPDWSEAFVARAVWAVRISRLGKDIAPAFAHRYHEGVHMAVLFASAEGCSCFDGSVALSPMAVEGTTLALAVDGRVVQEAPACELASAISMLIAHASRYLTLRTGDLILFGGAGEGVPVAEGQTLTGLLDGQAIMTIRIK